MPRGKTRSPLSLQLRRETAVELFEKGFSNKDVAKRLKVTPDTALNYRKWYENKAKEEVNDNPNLFSDTQLNIAQFMARNDLMRKSAWKQYHTTDSKQIKLQAINTLRNLELDRAKTLGLLGVKLDEFARFAKIERVMARVLRFLQQELQNEEDRARLIHMLSEGDVVEYMEGTPLPAIQAKDIIDV